MVTDAIIVNRKVLNRKVSVKKKYGTALHSFGAAVFIGAGTVAMMSALILIVLAAATASSFDGVEVILIVASFIFFGLGTHCLDLIEKTRRSQKIENYKFCQTNKKSY